MKTDHTPEPWHSECATVFKDIGDHRYEVAICADWSEETFANARRIVACVNACAGIPDEQLYDQEPGCLLSAMVEQEQEIMAITKQRDELLAALEWQPIETAPKDTFVLLAGPSGYTTIETVFATGRMCSDYHEGRWIDHANDDLTDWGFEPTHWMPLPDAPAIASAKGGDK